MYVYTDNYMHIKAAVKQTMGDPTSRAKAIHIYTYMHTYMSHVYIYVYVYVYIYIYGYVYMIYMCTCIDTYMYAYKASMNFLYWLHNKADAKQQAEWSNEGMNIRTHVL